MGRLQELYVQSQTLHDRMFSLENRIHSMVKQGRTPRKAWQRYLDLFDELRGVEAEMVIIQA